MVGWLAFLLRFFLSPEPSASSRLCATATAGDDDDDPPPCWTRPLCGNDGFFLSVAEAVEEEGGELLVDGPEDELLPHDFSRLPCDEEPASLCSDQRSA